MELDKDYKDILKEAVEEIRTARTNIARQVNAAAIGVYWNLGKLLFKRKIVKTHGRQIQG
ncbi:MAG: hypothetical protein EA361_11625 [Bacteroidetes bacterium]|nr:MAG: hypothetical protein EA361_11625 [Bacteroidota bacterium]